MAETVTELPALMIETSVLVDILRGVDEAADYLDRARTNAELVCSHVVEAELVVGTTSRSELRALKQMIARFRMEPITAHDSDRALTWLKKYFHKCGIGFHDCLIAAAALRLRVPLVTLNVKHFRVIRGLRILRPY